MSIINIRKKSVVATIWSLVDNLSTQFLGVIIGIILARLLTPSDFGTVGVLAIFIGISTVFVDCGFATGLVRKKDRSEKDLSTAFYFNVIVGLLAYLVLFLISPLVASFFRMPILTKLLRILALCLVFNSFSIVQNTILTATLNIRVQAWINVSTQFVMGCVGVYFAYQGYGVWTLVIQQVGSSILRCILLWCIGGWRPHSKWDEESFHYLFGFGWKLLGANLIGTIFNQIHGFFIGRALGANDLGLYSKANDLSAKPNTTLLNMINRVALPILAEVNNDISQIKQAFSKMVRIGVFVSFPLFFLLIVIAEPLILIIWTSKWTGSIVLFQILCVSASFGVVSQLGLTVMQLRNRTDLTLKYEFVKKPVTLILLIMAMPFGLFYITLSAAVASIYCSIVNMYATKKLIGYSYREQIRDFLPYLLLSMISALICFIIKDITDSVYISLLLRVVVFLSCYCSLAFILKLQGMRDIKSMINVNK